MVTDNFAPYSVCAVKKVTPRATYSYIKVNGKDVNPGTRLPLNSRIEISVGSGLVEEELIDSII